MGPRGLIPALLIALACTPGAAVHAQSLDQTRFEVTVATPDEFRAQADRVRASMDGGGRRAAPTTAQRARIDALLAEIEAVFAARGSGSALTEPDRLAVANAQGEINAILDGNDDQRLACEFVVQTGSHRRSKLCLTVQQRDALREEAQNALRGLDRGKLQGNPA